VQTYGRELLEKANFMKKLDESNELKYELDRHSSYGTATITTIT